jgi:8-oxo-dGTP diphosphatase
VTFAEGASAPFPMKYVSAGALFFDEQGRLLIVKPTYKDGWEIPGGIGTSRRFRAACARSVRRLALR